VSAVVTTSDECLIGEFAPPLLRRFSELFWFSLCLAFCCVTTSIGACAVTVFFSSLLFSVPLLLLLQDRCVSPHRDVVKLAAAFNAAINVVVVLAEPMLVLLATPPHGSGRDV
jgi:hypothetical protein